MPTSIILDASSFMGKLKAVISTVSRYIEWVKMERWLLSGTEFHGGEKLTILYTGVSVNKNYFVSLVFGDNYEEKYLGRCHIWQLIKYLDKANSGYSIIVTESLKIFKNIFRVSGYFYIPGWVKGMLFLPKDFTSIFKNSSIKSDISRIKRNSFVCEVKKDLASLNKFYYDMYLPFTQSRYDKAAIVNTYEYMRRKFNRCVLIFIRKDDEVVAGVMVSSIKNYGRLWVLGVQRGKDGCVQEGAIAALYYYSLRYLHDHSSHEIYVGSTRAFLNDGVLQYKKKWGYRITGEKGAGFFIKITEDTSAVRSFLLHNPYINVDKVGNNAMFFAASEVSAHETLKGIKSGIYPQGLDWIVISTLMSNTEVKPILKIHI
jgi:hypothetical protein